MQQRILQSPLSQHCRLLCTKDILQLSWPVYSASFFTVLEHSISNTSSLLLSICSNYLFFGWKHISVVHLSTHRTWPCLHSSTSQSLVLLSEEINSQLKFMKEIVQSISMNKARPKKAFHCNQTSQTPKKPNSVIGSVLCILQKGVWWSCKAPATRSTRLQQCSTSSTTSANSWPSYCSGKSLLIFHMLQEFYIWNNRISLYWSLLVSLPAYFQWPMVGITFRQCKTMNHLI